MKTILLDADIVAFKVASVAEERYEWEPGEETYAFDRPGARRHTDELVGEYADACKATGVIVCLTDAVNFRKELNPEYKSNRQGVRKPELLQFVKDYLASEYVTFQRPRLEADDIMGILATTDRWIPGEKIMVSEDKDMRTIPGNLYNPRNPDLGVIEISPLDADRFHMWQTLVGDSSDGYPGCPGVGPVKAEPLIGMDADELWDFVLEWYYDKGLTETDAILQARMARILRASDWNNKKKKVRLWVPELLLMESGT